MNRMQTYIRLRVHFHHRSRADRCILIPRVSRERSGRLCGASAAWPSRASWQIKRVNNRLLWQLRHYALSWIKGRLKRKNCNRHPSESFVARSARRFAARQNSLTGFYLENVIDGILYRSTFFLIYRLDSLVGVFIFHQA